MTAPEPTPYTPTDAQVRYAWAYQASPGVRVTRVMSDERDAEFDRWLARVRAEAVLDYVRTKEVPRVEITPLAGPARPGPMSTLQDRDAETTTTTQPEPDAAPQEDPCAGHYHDAWSPPGSRPDCQSVEPEPDERDALASALHAFGDGLFADEHRVPWAQVSHAARRYRLAQADAVLAAGFRRSRPEAT